MSKRLVTYKTIKEMVDIYKAQDPDNLDPEECQVYTELENEVFESVRSWQMHKVKITRKLITELTKELYKDSRFRYEDGY